VLPESLDLRTAVVYALENSFTIRQARERIQQQDGVVLEVSARGIPNVGVGAAYQRNDADISQSFPADDSAWQIQIQARQSLYSGGAVQGAAASARLTREAAVLELQAVINDVLLAVRTRFYDVLLARESINVQEQSIALLEEQLQNARNRYEAGAASLRGGCGVELRGASRGGRSRERPASPHSSPQCVPHVLGRGRPVDRWRDQWVRLRAAHAADRRGSDRRAGAVRCRRRRRHRPHVPP
jgi:hypothetical protein